jgi:thioredoxin 1
MHRGTVTFVPRSHVTCRSSSSNSSNNDVDNQHDRNDIRSSKNATPKITKIQGLDEFLEFLAESDDRIVVVDFYAAWCKSCHKFGMKFKQLANRYADKVNDDGEILERGKVRFATVEYGANVRLCKTFGIKKLPFVHIYKAPLGKISEFVCGPKYFDEKLKSRVVEYLDMTDDEIKFRMDMEDGQALGVQFLEDAKKGAVEMKSDATTSSKKYTS